MSNSNTMSKNRNGDEVLIPPKDEEEILLEKLVFGDVQGFETNLRKLDNLYDYSSEEQDEGSNESDETSDDENDLEDVQDDQLFFIDDGTNEAEGDKDAMDIYEDSQSDDEIDDEEDDNDSEIAWEDSDDDTLNISLLSSDKVRKLRKVETDSTINGKSYITRLRSQFEKIYPKPEWVDKLQLEENDMEDEDSDAEVIGNEDDEITEASNNDNNAVLKLLSSTQQFIITKQLKLISPNKISITRLKDANHSKLSKAAIQSLSFHHSHPLLLTGGFDRTLRIYHIDGKTNNIVTTLHLRNSPISSCYFSPFPSKDNKNLIFAGGRRRYMNKWDLNTGEVEKISRMYGHEQFQRSMEYFKISSKGSYIGLTGSSGWCNILNGLTGQWIKGFKIEGTIMDFEFANDETFIIVINSAGEVWEFELSNDNASKNESKKEPTHHNKIIRRWQDDSGTGITKIKLGGPKNRWLAIGTNNGIVNIYDRNTLTDGRHPKPIKTIENLVTSISSLNFTPDGQILCIASRAKKDALRLVHLPSCSVYSNWPTSGTPLGRVTAVTFSPNNEMLAIGNEGGKVTLWRINHY